MRRVTVLGALSAVMLFSMVPVSGQSVSDLTLQITNSAGPVAACPVTVNFVATISMNWPASTLVQTRYIQYKWINSSNIVEPAQTLNFYSTKLGPASIPIAITTPLQVKNAWNVAAGSYWEALQVTYPVVLTSPSRAYVVTCPILGSLSLPVAPLSGSISPPLIRP